MKDASSLSASSASEVPRTAALRWVLRGFLIFAALLIVGVLAWQGLTASGNPNPTAPQTSAFVAILDIAVLVFREGLECILVLSAITASMIGANQSYRRPIAAGAGIGFLVTLVTWFVAVGIISDLSTNFSALNLQAATGLLAVIVLLVVMNWFFHKIYWGGWISMHNRRKKDLIQDDKSAETTRAGLLWGLGLLGFFSVYREGVEVVLFLQSYNLKLGGQTVLLGTLLGLFFTGIVAILNFIAHQRLPYRKMMILTGIMLGFVLLVMVGEEAYEMQQANWISTTTIASLQDRIPAWAGVWFSLFPTVETILAQVFAAVLVIGSYYLARHLSAKDSRPGEPATV